MADAPIQLDLSQRQVVASTPETLPSGSALRRRRGGTGFSVDTLGELQAELEIPAPGVDGGFAPLDSGLLVPIAYLPTMVGATDVAAGERGVVPQPPAGAHRRALVGDGTYASDLEANNLYPPSNLDKPALQLASTGDGEDSWILAARGSGTWNARAVTRSGVDEVVHARVDPLGQGWLSVRGDPVTTRRRFSRRLMTKVDAVGWYASGLDAPTEFGTVTNESYAFGRGQYQVYAYTDTTGSVAGLQLPPLVQRRATFSVLFVVEFQLFLTTRVWLGLFNGDPSGSSDPSTLQGFAIRYDATADSVSNNFRLWGSDGGGVSSVQVLDGSVSPFVAAPLTVNVQHRFLLRNVPQNAGRFEAWLQRGDEDSDAAKEGSWYFLGMLDSGAGDKVPATATTLAPWITYTNLGTTGSTNRKVRVQAIDVSGG